MDHPRFSRADISAHPASVLPGLIRIAEQAGEIALQDFRPGEKTSAQVWNKTGNSPVTAADIAVDEFLSDRLSLLCPDAGWLSEETADNAARLARPLVWIVDPIDGTRAFMSGHEDWSVSIALYGEGGLIAGIVHAPALKRTYTAAKGHGAQCNGTPIATSPRETVAAARTAGPGDVLARLAHLEPSIVRVPRVPSLALRLARVAEGAIEAGLVSRDARDWDIAAADLILTEAGGIVTNLAGEAPLYNRPMPVHGALVASGMPLHAGLMEAARQVFKS